MPLTSVPTQRQQPPTFEVDYATVVELAAARGIHGPSAMSREFGISRQALYNHSKGKWRPNLATAHRIASVLGVAIEDLGRAS